MTTDGSMTTHRPKSGDLSMAFGTKGVEHYHHVWPKQQPAAPQAGADTGLDASYLLGSIVAKYMARAAEEGILTLNADPQASSKAVVALVSENQDSRSFVHEIAEQYQRDTGRTASLAGVQYPGDSNSPGAQAAAPATPDPTQSPFFIAPPSARPPTLEPPKPTWANKSSDKWSEN